MGKKLSEEHKNNIRLGMLGKKNTLGFKHSEKTLKIQSERMKGNTYNTGKKHRFPPTKEHRERIAQTKRGKKRPEITGENNKHWKGDKVGYRSLHRWVEGKLGKPKYCSNCQNIEAKRYHWANISKSYRRDLSDWIRLCVSCHKRYDLGMLKLDLPLIKC